MRTLKKIKHERQTAIKMFRHFHWLYSVSLYLYVTQTSYIYFKICLLRKKNPFPKKKAIKQKTPFQPPYFFLILPISQRFNLGPSAPIHNCCSKDPHIYTALHNYFIMKFCLSHGSHKILLPTREVGYIRKPTLFYSSKKHP